jgi:hypothetical protein
MLSYFVFGLAIFGVICAATVVAFIMADAQTEQAAPGVFLPIDRNGDRESHRQTTE